MAKGKKSAAVLIVAVSLLLSPIIALSAGQERIPKKAEEKTASLSLKVEKISRPEIVVKIIIDPGGQPINAVGVPLSFNPKLLTIKSINTANSFCELFVEKTFDNQKGLINIACGRPYPGISKQGEVAGLTLKIKKFGLAELKFGDDAQTLANDGFGTDVLQMTKNISIMMK